jgi:hypothetical protein
MRNLENKIELVTAGSDASKLIKVNDESYEPNSNGAFFIPLEQIEDININFSPIGERITLYRDGDIHENGFRKEFENMGNGFTNISFEGAYSNKYWPLDPELELFKRLKAELILTKKAVNPKIDEYNDDDFYYLTYYIDLPSDTLKNLLESSNKFERSIDKEIENSFKNIENLIRQYLGLPSVELEKNE